MENSPFDNIDQYSNIGNNKFNYYCGDYACINNVNAREL